MNWKINTYYLSIALFTVGICCSKFLMSMGLFTGGIHFLFTANYKEKFKILFKNPFFILLFIFYILHITGIFWSSNLNEGLLDIKQKSTLLIIPLIVFSINNLNEKLNNWVKILFISTLFLTSCINYLGFHLFFDELDLKETRNMSLFIGHIRYALAISLATIWCFHEIINKSDYRSVYIILFLWFTFYTIESQVLSGIVSLGLAIFFYSIWKLFNEKKWLLISLLTITSVAFLFSLFYYLNLPIRTPEKTIPINSKTISAWKTKSNIPLTSEDKKNQPIQFTLNRYLFSLNLPLSEKGIIELSDQDILNIEDGIADIRETYWSFFSRLFKIRYEIQVEKNPNLHPIIERIELWKNAWFTIKKNWLFGVGNGSEMQALNQSYEIRNSKLVKERRLRPHNMFLTYWLIFGLIGIFFLITIILFFGRAALISNNILGFVFIVIVGSSFFSEDTLESQAGITFFTFFYCFFGAQILNKNLKE